MTTKRVTKRVTKTKTGLESLIGLNVLLMCANYFYSGKLLEVGADFVTLGDPSIVYETGPWNSADYADVQPIQQKRWYVQRAAIESFGLSK